MLNIFFNPWKIFQYEHVNSFVFGLGQIPALGSCNYSLRYSKIILPLRLRLLSHNYFPSINILLRTFYCWPGLQPTEQLNNEWSVENLRLHDNKLFCGHNCPNMQYCTAVLHRHVCYHIEQTQYYYAHDITHRLNCLSELKTLTY